MRAASCHADRVAGIEAEPAAGGPRSEAPRRLLAWAAGLEARRPEDVLLVILSFCAVVPLLYIARAADGNALTSWRWTFSGARAAAATVALVPCVAAAAVAARASLRVRVPPALVAGLAGAVVVPLWAEPEIVLDASRYLVQARFVEEYGAAWFLREWGRSIDAWTDLPLVPFAYGVAFSAAGPARAVAQALDTVLFALTALLGFRIARALWDEETALHAALLLAGIPFLLVQVPLLLVDVPAMFLLALFASALLGLVRRGGTLRLGGCALGAAAAALAKYSLWPMLLAVAAGVIASARGERRLAATRTAWALLVAALLVGAAIAARPDVFAAQARLLAGFQAPGLGRWQEGFLSTFFFQAHPLVALLAAAGAARAAMTRDASFLAVGGALLLAAGFGSARARYAVPLLPFVALAAAYGLGAVRDRGTRRLVSLGVVASALVVAYGAYLPFLRSTSLANLAAAGRLLDGLAGDLVEVRALPQRLSSGNTAAAIPLLAYATRKRVACPEPWPTGGDETAVRASPLRFSWELRRPPFFAAPGASRVVPAAVVVISGEPASAPQPGLRERARFDATSGVFKYQTLVTVYEREPRT